jgi:hypothetical protein
MKPTDARNLSKPFTVDLRTQDSVAKSHDKPLK